MLLCTTQEGEDIPAGSVDGHKCSVIPRGHVWLEGDNPLASYDSRDHGAIPLALVYGRVRYKVCTCMLLILASFFALSKIFTTSFQLHNVYCNNVLCNRKQDNALYIPA